MGLKLIQIGIGAWGWSWARIVKESKYWDTVAYVDLNEERLRKASIAYHMERSRCYTSLDEALSKVEADAVLVVVPPAAHNEVAIKALKAGLHVLVEKPLADDIEKAKRMVAEAKKRNLKHTSRLKFKGKYIHLFALISIPILYLKISI